MAAADRGLLRNRAFLAIWGAQILSQVASNAVTSALIILVAEITHSNTSSSFLILLAVLPAVLFGIAGGLIVDRTDRRLVLMITNALRAAAIVPLLLFGSTSLTVISAAGFLVEAFHYLRSTPRVSWALVYIAMTYTLVAVAGALAPGFVREVLKVGERNVVILVAPAGIGVVAGLAFLNVIGPRIGRANAISAGL